MLVHVYYQRTGTQNQKSPSKVLYFAGEEERLESDKWTKLATAILMIATNTYSFFEAVLAQMSVSLYSE